MIQRIQTVYFFLAALVMGGLFLDRADLLRIESPAPAGLGEMAYFNDQILDVYDQTWLGVFTGMVMLFAILAIFLFRNRKLQLALSRVSMLLVVMFFGLSAYLMYSDLASSLSSIRLSPGWGIVLPIIVVVFLILASRGIRRDDKLVKSMDRLR